MAKGVTHDQALTALQSSATMHRDSAVARSKGAAELLDRVTEALERLAASLRDA